MLRRHFTLALVTCAVALSACGGAQSSPAPATTTEAAPVGQVRKDEVDNAAVNGFVEAFDKVTQGAVSSLVDKGSEQGLRLCELSLPRLVLTVAASETESPYLEVRIPIAGQDQAAVREALADCMAVLDEGATEQAQAALDDAYDASKATDAAPVTAGKVRMSFAYAEDGTLTGLTLAKTES